VPCYGAVRGLIAAFVILMTAVYLLPGDKRNLEPSLALLQAEDYPQSFIGDLVRG
jgi:hypothetical protein